MICYIICCFPRPTPTYSWTVTRFDGFERRISNGKDGYDLSDFNHILTIKSINLKHEGLYKCKAESSYGGKKHVDVMEGRIMVKGETRKDKQNLLERTRERKKQKYERYKERRKRNDKMNKKLKKRE